MFGFLHHNSLVPIAKRFKRPVGCQTVGVDFAAGFDHLFHERNHECIAWLDEIEAG